MEWKLFAGDVPYVSTFDYHEHRDRAPHIDQREHQPRMQLALDFVSRSHTEFFRENGSLADFTVVDLGCGDGGFVSAMKGLLPGADILGFDFTPDMENGWLDRGVAENCRRINVFPAPPEQPAINSRILPEVAEANVVVMTEVLEHLARPHEVLKLLAGFSAGIVVSSPWGETNRNHDPSHAWAWDQDGYVSMIESAGFVILDYARAGFSQVVRARSEEK